MLGPIRYTQLLLNPAAKRSGLPLKRKLNSWLYVGTGLRDWKEQVPLNVVYITDRDPESVLTVDLFQASFCSSAHSLKIHWCFHLKGKNVINNFFQNYHCDHAP